MRFGDTIEAVKMPQEELEQDESRKIIHISSVEKDNELIASLQRRIQELESEVCEQDLQILGLQRDNDAQRTRIDSVLGNPAAQNLQIEQDEAPQSKVDSQSVTPVSSVWNEIYIAKLFPGKNFPSFCTEVFQKINEQRESMSSDLVSSEVSRGIGSHSTGEQQDVFETTTERQKRQQELIDRAVEETITAEDTYEFVFKENRFVNSIRHDPSLSADGINLFVTGLAENGATLCEQLASAKEACDRAGIKVEDVADKTINSSKGDRIVFAPLIKDVAPKSCIE